MPHTYGFHTNIMLVNKTIHKEAKELFLKNRFVVVRHAWPGLTGVMQVHDVPMVSGRPVRKPSDCAAAILFIRHPQALATQTETFTLAARDLRSFRRAMGWTLLQALEDITFVIPEGGGRSCTVPASAMTGEVFKTDIFFTPLIGTNPDKIRKFGLEIRQLSLPIQKVKVYTDSVFNQNMTEHFQKDMSQAKYSAPSLLSSVLRETFAMKKAADELVRIGQYEAAHWRFRGMAEAFRMWKFVDSCHAGSDFSPSVAKTLALLLRLFLDIVETAAELQIRLRGPGFLDTLSEIQRLLESYLKALIYPTSLIQWEEIMNVSQSDVFRIAHLLAAGDEENLGYARWWLTTRQQFHDKDREYRAHDIKQVERVLKDPHLLTEYESGHFEICDLLSCSVFPARIFVSCVFLEPDVIELLEGDIAIA